MSPAGGVVDVSTLSFDNNGNNNTCLYRMPIVGYEVLEERSRFTVRSFVILSVFCKQKNFILTLKCNDLVI